ncbi:hypothetical protein FOA52_000656 [Chlamydomonas sp. UWO 241]|nr:hypothetical protein FOA52_000656 [Chlamydomonas sp. UWO 241]
MPLVYHSWGGGKIHLRRLLTWLVLLLATWGVLEIAVTALRRSARHAQLAGDPTLGCTPDGEGQWAIGVFRGHNPFHLKPLEQLQGALAAEAFGIGGADSSTEAPPSNPVLTCASVTDVESGFVADPFLWPSKDKSNTIHMFYETKSLLINKGEIGAAVSVDGGATFKHLGVVLGEPWHLSYPFVFEDEGHMYMVPEGSNSGVLTLYRAMDFPLKWVKEKVLIDAPLIDASPFKWNGRWFLFASNRREKSSKNCRELEVWHSDTLMGEWTRHPMSPWTRYPMSPVRAWLQGARMAGRPIVHNGSLYRFGQDCAHTYGHRIRAFRVTKLDTENYAEEEVEFSFGGSDKLRPGIDWNGQRYHHIDAHQLPGLGWIAAMDGDRYYSDYLTWWRVQQTAVLLPLAAALTGGAAVLSVRRAGRLGAALHW